MAWIWFLAHDTYLKLDMDLGKASDRFPGFSVFSLIYGYWISNGWWFRIPCEGGKIGRGSHANSNWKVGI